MNRHHFVPKVLAPLSLAVAVTGARPASAEPPPPVDVVIPPALAPQRVLTVEWNPLPLFVSKLSADVVITPADHHALVIAPFYAWPTTAPLQVAGTDTAGNAVTIGIESQKFTAFGAELGYRYYTGTGGPRGFFAGPSLVLSSVTATAGNGDTTPFLEYGLALDMGYGAIVADRIALTFGAGAEYSATSKTIPPQQFPAAIYANRGLYPRLLFAAGYSF